MSVVTVTNEVNQQIVAQVPNILLLVHAAQATVKDDGTPLIGAEKGAGVSQVVTDILTTTHGVPADGVAVAQSVNLVYQLLVALGIFKKKAANP